MNGSTVLQETTDRLAEQAERIIVTELLAYAARTSRSKLITERAKQALPSGVASSFQTYDPHPIVAARAAGARLWDVDGNEYVDFNMGYGALFVGHGHPVLVDAVQRQLTEGTLFVTPTESNTTVAEMLKERFNLDLVRFTNSGTEATHDALRAARAFTGRERIAKVEGGYHGHHDEALVSTKPPLNLAGPPEAPHSVPASQGLAAGVVKDVAVVPYNNLFALHRVLRNGDIAAFILEPAMENIGICLPDPGYLAGVRTLCDRYGTVLIFDEVKTGITAGWGGATRHFGVQPDLVCVAKSIGGGLPVGAFGGRAEIMAKIASGDVLHLGTFNGNPLVMAAAAAVMGEICTQQATTEVVARNSAMVARMQAIVDEYELPAHTVKLGAKGCVTYSEARVRNYRDYKSTDFRLAYANWIWGINRGILLPPGLDEQWLVSMQHTDADLNCQLEVFEDFAAELRS